MDVLSLTTFRHEPLPDPQSYIRLLEILPGGPSEHLTCRLRAWPIQTVPSYCALSYTWGDPASTIDILLNGSRMTVRSNGEYSLRQAQSLANSKYIWQDALCIDQSNTHEKNFQVAMMGEIYQKAAHVLTCLGPHSEDSKFLFGFMDKNHKLMRMIYSHVSESLVSGLGGSLPNPIPQNRQLALRCFFAVTGRMRERVAASYFRMMERSYFSRVWVLQEMHLASQISFCCGKDRRSFDSLLATSMLVDYWIETQTHLHFGDRLTRGVASILSKTPWILRRQNTLIRFSTSQESAKGKTRRMCLALALSSLIPLPLEEVLIFIQDFECFDVRDRLYGVSSLVDWYSFDGGDVPAPDYSKDPFSLAVEILQRYVLQCELLVTPIHWLADELLKVFKIPSTPHDTQMTLRMRHIGIETAGGGATDSSRNSTDLHFLSSTDRHTTPSRLDGPEFAIRSVLDQKWYGIRLLSVDNGCQDTRVKQSRRLRYRRAQYDERLVEIVDHDGTAFAHVPTDTQPHDIYMFAPTEYNKYSDSVGATVRMKEPGVYAIVGYASWIGPNRGGLTRSLEWDCFEVQWSAEELLRFGCGKAHWLEVQMKSFEEEFVWTGC